MTSRSAWFAVLCVLGIALGAARVRADEASGTWTGAIEGRGNYYWERSTRVVVPAAKIKLTAPNGLRVGADYLVDVITSASIAQTGSSVDQLFTELRHGMGAELGKEIDLGSSQLDLGVHGTYSTEPDYKSVIYGLRSELTLDEKNTELKLAAARVQDEIRSSANPMFKGELSGFTVAAGIERVINRVMVLSVSYQFGYLQGFLANVYRGVPIADQPIPVPERHPDERFRHTASARLKWYIPQSRTALHLLYSAYGDSWDIAALTPELRIYQEVGDDFLIRPHYRFYAQTKAYFQMDLPYPADWTGPVTNDPKMAAFVTHTLGLSLEYRLSFLRGGPLDFAKGTWLDLAFDRYWSTSTFGNGVIATAGGRIEF